MTTKELIELYQRPSSRAFIEEKREADIHKLLLKYGGDTEKKALAEQIAQRRKIRKKLPEWAANEELLFPKSLSLEQCSSEATAKLKASLIRGTELLDITGGLGVDTFYLSASFDRTTYVEKQEDLCQLARYNFARLQAGIQVKNADGSEELQKSRADFIYADPARRGEHNKKLIRLSEYEPDLTLLTDELTAEGRSCLIKTSPMLDISSAIGELEYVSEVWVISHKNECKEVLYLLDREQSQDLTYRTFNILSSGLYREFRFRPTAPAVIPMAEDLDNYIYEPDSSILKAGGTDHIAKAYGLEKLHPNSNFLQSDILLSDFPGRTFKVTERRKPYDKGLRKQRFNVISRNYPDNADLIQTKLRILPSQNDYLIATRLKDEYLFIVCTLVA